jgi:hypothetical protein
MKFQCVQQSIPYDIPKDHCSQVDWLNASSHEIFNVIVSVNNVSLPYDEETRELKKTRL